MSGNNDKNRNLTLRRKKMKLSILLAGSILTSEIVGNAYAQTSRCSAIVLLSRVYLYWQHFRLCQYPDEVPL